MTVSSTVLDAPLPGSSANSAAPMAAAPKSSSRVGWGKAGRSVTGNSALSLFDQALVSAANFATMVIVGRSGGEAQVGFYQLAISLVLLATTLQTALISAPYMVYGPRLGQSRRRRYAGSSLVLQLAFAALASLAVLLFAGVAGQQPRWLDFTQVLFVTAAVLPLLLLREFLRRTAFANLTLRPVVMLDLAVATVQILLLVALALWMGLTAQWALLVAGGACGSVSLVAWWSMRRAYRVRSGAVGADLARSWRFGRWVGLDQALATVRSYVVFWMLAALSGADDAGLLAICMSLILMTNPILIGASNVLGPQAAAAFAQGHLPALRHVMRRWTLLLGIAIALAVVLFIAAGGPMLRLIYNQFNPQAGLVVAILAITAVAWLGDQIAHVGLLAVEHPKASVAANAIGLVASVVATVPLIAWWGVPGAAVAIVIGAVTVCLIKLFAFARIQRNLAFGKLTVS